MSLLAAHNQAAKEAWLQLSAGQAAQASSVTIYENLVSLTFQDVVSTRKGVAFWISGHKQESFLEIPLHHQARVDAIDVSVVAISCGLIGEGSPLSDSGNGFFTLAKRISWGSPLSGCRDAARDDASHGARRRGARGQRCALCHLRGDVARRGGSQVAWKHHKAFEVTTSELDRLQSGVVDPRPSRSRRLRHSSDASAEERRPSGGLPRWARSESPNRGVSRLRRHCARVW